MATLGRVHQEFMQQLANTRTRGASKGDHRLGGAAATWIPWETKVKRLISIGLAAVLVIGVALAVIFGSGGGTDSTPLTTVRGVIGSEKLAFFSDQRVKDAFAKHGLDVQVDPAGSRQMATQTDLSKYD